MRLSINKERGYGVAKRTIRGSGQLTKVEGCEDIERILRDTKAIEKIVQKGIKIIEAVNVKNVADGDPQAMKMATMGLNYARVIVDVHKFHVGVSTKTVESENEVEALLEGEDDAALLEMIGRMETLSGEKILDVEASVADDGGSRGQEDEEVEESEV